MIKTPISVQDLRKNLYIKAKTEPTWRFWGLYAHVCKRETLQEAYEMAKKNDGAPGIDGVTFEAIEESGKDSFLERIREELITGTYQPMPVRKKEIPKDGGTKVRVLSIPSIRDRVVQGALKLILEPIFEADFQPGSYGYRPKRTAHEAINCVAQGIVETKTKIIDLDLRAYFDTVQHSLLLDKVAKRVRDDQVMRLLKMILKATGKKGVPQGGVITPLTQKVISSLNEQLRDGKRGTLCLIFVLSGNIFMAHDAFDQSGKSSAAERRSWFAPAPSGAARSSAAAVTRVRFVRASSLSLPGRSFPARSPRRRSPSYGASYVEASAAYGGTSPEVREKQRTDHGSNRDRRVACVSPHSKKAWLSRVEKAAHFKSMFPIRLIACSSRSSRRPTIFWYPVASAPSACA